MARIYKTTRCGLEVFTVELNGREVGQFMSEQGARTKLLSLVRG